MRVSHGATIQFAMGRAWRATFQEVLLALPGPMREVLRLLAAEPALGPEVLTALEQHYVPVLVELTGPAGRRDLENLRGELLAVPGEHGQLLLESHAILGQGAVVREIPGLQALFEHAGPWTEKLGLFQDVLFNRGASMPPGTRSAYLMDLLQSGIIEFGDTGIQYVYSLIVFGGSRAPSPGGRVPVLCTPFQGGCSSSTMGISVPFQVGDRAIPSTGILGVPGCHLVWMCAPRPGGD
jgi:hypothetical protein